MYWKSLSNLERNGHSQIPFNDVVSVGVMTSSFCFTYIGPALVNTDIGIDWVLSLATVPRIKTTYFREEGTLR